MVLIYYLLLLIERYIISNIDRVVELPPDNRLTLISSERATPRDETPHPTFCRIIADNPGGPGGLH